MFGPRPSAEPPLEPRSSLFFASLDATVGGLQQQAQDLFGRINDGRKEDHTVLSGLRDSLLLKVGPAPSPPSPPAPGAPPVALFRPV